MRRAMSETMDTSVFPQAVLIRWSPLRCRMTDAAFRRQSLQPFGKALPAENFPLPTGVGWVLRLPAKWSLITVERSPLTVCQDGNPMRHRASGLLTCLTVFLLLKTIRPLDL